MATRGVRDRARSPFELAWRQRFRHFAASREDDAGIAGWSTSGLEARVKRFNSLFHRARPGSLWLDAGCGAGTYTRLLATHEVQVIGLDYELLSTRKARERDDAKNNYVAGDVCRLPFVKAGFDGALCFGVTQALSSSAPAIRELTRVTAPGGEIWIDALNRACIVHLIGQALRRLKRKPVHLRYEYPKALCRLMKDSGLRNVELHWLPILPSTWQSAQRIVESRVARSIFRHVPLVGMLLSHAFIVRAVKP